MRKKIRQAPVIELKPRSFNQYVKFRKAARVAGVPLKRWLLMVAEREADQVLQLKLPLVKE